MCWGLSISVLEVVTRLASIETDGTTGIVHTFEHLLLTLWNNRNILLLLVHVRWIWQEMRLLVKAAWPVISLMASWRISVRSEIVSLRCLIAIGNSLLSFSKQLLIEIVCFLQLAQRYFLNWLLFSLLSHVFNGTVFSDFLYFSLKSCFKIPKHSN